MGLNSESEGKEGLPAPQALELVWERHGGPRRAEPPSCQLAGMWATHLLWPPSQHQWVLLTAHLAYLCLPEGERHD